MYPQGLSRPERACYQNAMQVEDIMKFYCSTYVYTRAHTHILRLELAGFQAGSLVSGNMRGKLFKKLSSGD